MYEHVHLRMTASEHTQLISCEMSFGCPRDLHLCEPGRIGPKISWSCCRLTCFMLSGPSSSGKPCPKFTLPYSFARFVMVVNIVVGKPEKTLLRGFLGALSEATAVITILPERARADFDSARDLGRAGNNVWELKQSLLCILGQRRASSVAPEQSRLRIVTAAVST